MSAFYNEFDPKAAAWLGEIIKRGHLPPGRVDARSVTDVEASATEPVSHFFAGIGGWPYALRLAGWPDSRPVWTASLPCQPFSRAGKGKGVDDERHLWPVFQELVAECAPPVIFGEQVASPSGRSWLADVRLDLEALGYAVGAADLCAAGAGAPHLRQRLFWGACWLGDPSQQGLEGRGVSRNRAGQRAAGSAGVGSGRLGNGDGGRQPGHPQSHVDGQGDGLDALRHRLDTWAPAGLVLCADGRARPLAPISRRVADGVPARVGLLRGYGNAIVPQLAAEFVAAFSESVNFLVDAPV